MHCSRRFPDGAALTAHYAECRLVPVPIASVAGAGPDSLAPVIFNCPRQTYTVGDPVLTMWRFKAYRARVLRTFEGPRPPGRAGRGKKRKSSAQGRAAAATGSASGGKEGEGEGEEGGGEGEQDDCRETGAGAEAEAEAETEAKGATRWFYVHYDGFGEKYDTWVGPDQLIPGPSPDKRESVGGKQEDETKASPDKTSGRGEGKVRDPKRRPGSDAAEGRQAKRPRAATHEEQDKAQGEGASQPPRLHRRHSAPAPALAPSSSSSSFSSACRSAPESTPARATSAGQCEVCLSEDHGTLMVMCDHCNGAPFLSMLNHFPPPVQRRSLLLSRALSFLFSLHSLTQRTRPPPSLCLPSPLLSLPPDGYHVYCLPGARPSETAIPEGAWECPECDEPPGVKPDVSRGHGKSSSAFHGRLGVPGKGTGRYPGYVKKRGRLSLAAVRRRLRERLCCHVCRKSFRDDAGLHQHVLRSKCKDQYGKWDEPN